MNPLCCTSSALPGQYAKQDGRFVWWESATFTRLRYDLRSCSACRSEYVDRVLMYQSVLPAGFFDIASTRILSVDVAGNPKLSVYYRVNSASDATRFQTYKGPMTLLEHQEFRFYEQEPAGVRIIVGLRERGGQPIASGEYVVQGDEAGLPIAVHLQDSTGREIAQIVFLLSCAPGKDSIAACAVSVL